MNIEDLQTICQKLPLVTEDIKWGHDLCFCIGQQMFLVVGLDQSPTGASFKVPDEDFEMMIDKEGFKPAAYLARYKWLHVKDIDLLSKKEWAHYAEQSYNLIKKKLPKNKQK